MFVLDDKEIDSIESLEAAITSMPEETKDALRKAFELSKEV